MLTAVMRLTLGPDGSLSPPHQVHEGLDEAAEYRERQSGRKQLTLITVLGEPTSQWHRQHRGEVVQHHHYLHRNAPSVTSPLENWWFMLVRDMNHFRHVLYNIFNHVMR